MLWASYQIRKIAGCACVGNVGNFSPAPRVSDPDMHHGTCVTHVPWCMPGSLTSGSFWSWWRGKRSRHSRRMHNPQFYAFGKRPMMRLENNTSFPGVSSFQGLDICESNVLQSIRNTKTACQEISLSLTYTKYIHILPVLVVSHLHIYRLVLIVIVTADAMVRIRS